MMSNAWSWYVIALVVLNIAGCVALLWWTGKRRPGDPAPTDTSHFWDEDITEYNKPMPRWWINLFYITVVFAIGYMAYYPGLGAVAGTSKWTSAREHDADKAREDKKLALTFGKYDGQPIDALAGDPQALKLGKAIFANNCATCHGSAAQGAIGYPNLTDDIWHWGGSPDQVLQSVVAGRQGVMAPWGQVLTGMGGENAVDNVVAYVRTLSGPEQGLQNNYMAAQGKKLFDSLCTACHGPAGKGNQSLGAPDLTDDYWLYGDGTDSLRETIIKGRHGIMPAHGELLGETRARVVAAYAYSLSRGKPAGTQ